jgi:hypothetical protein
MLRGISIESKLTYSVPRKYKRKQINRSVDRHDTEGSRLHYNRTLYILLIYH